MLHARWIGLSTLAITTITGSRSNAYNPSPALEQPLQLSQNDISQEPLFSLHRSLVNIESVSGNESHVASYLDCFLTSHNYTVERQVVTTLPSLSTSKRAGQRVNILAYPGDLRQTRVLLTSHIDTVPPYYGYELRDHNQIGGRGSVDAKACVATQFQALQELLGSTDISPNDASLLFVVGEEMGGDGMIAVNDLGMKWETVIFGEPTELKLASGHKGILIFTITAYGKAGHSGYPWLGKSAIHTLLHALVALQELDLPSSKKYGQSTLNIGFIQGGVAANVIAEIASAKMGIRLAGGDAQAVKTLITNAIKNVDDSLNVEFHGGAYGPVYIDSDVEGFETITVNYGTDIPNLKGSHKRYLYGPGSIQVAHSDHEYLEAEDLFQAVKGYKRLVRAALGL